jgi:FemAB-related protein (PEP-CTERM system-associated)
MRVVAVDATHRDRWDEYVVGHPEAGPYHRWAWLEAVSRAYGFEPAPLLATRNGKVLGVLPLVRFGRPGCRGWLVSLPYCDFAGPLADDRATGDSLREGALKAAKELGAVGVEIRVQAPPEESVTPKVLMRMALPEGQERLFGGFPAKLRSQIRKPQRDGLTASMGGEDLLPSFYKVFARNMRDLGSPTHSLNWFREVVRGYGENVRITVVSLPDGTPCAAGIMLLQGSRAYVPWASSLRKYNRQNANMLLYWAMLSWASDACIGEFDFGRSTPGEGTYRFKRQWGAQAVGLAWERLVTVGKIETAFRPKGFGLKPLAECCWSRLPLPVANWVGPLVRRYISL